MTGAPAPLSLAELERRSPALRDCAAWQALESHARAAAAVPLARLLDEPGRHDRHARAAAGIHLDFSRQRLLDDTLPLLAALAAERNLGDWIAHLFAGADVNGTEARPALHVALRRGEGGPLAVRGVDVMPAVRAELGRFLAVAAEIGSGRWAGHGGQPVTDVVNIGIGGSDLGLVMAVEALRPHATGAVRLHFVSNIDGTQLHDALGGLDPARTLFIVCSKSFTTLETQLNADAARRWLVARLPEQAVGRHFLAVSVNDAAMDRFGIAPANRFRIWDWVGGRYSLWSSVGLAIAIAVGRPNFEELLAGAAAMDEHFRTAPVVDNLPAILGLLGVWNQNFLGATSHAVLPYTQRLHRFPAFLQQLEMESNGKGVTRDGTAAAWPTGSLVWGEPGSNAQHAFFQLLHQGTARFSADFVAPACSERAESPDQHLAGLANMLAQAEALARGRTEAEVVAELTARGVTGDAARRLAPHRRHPGNHPSTVVLFDRLDPRRLGALVALYEHKVFVQAVIWGINPFDQWGVELGKTLAGSMGAALADPARAASLTGAAAEILRLRAPGAGA
jgi:glucose-6-phosphate isomerase